MNTPRYVIAAVCFGALVYTFLTMPFGDRGFHFVPEATAEEATQTGGEGQASGAPDGYDLSKLRVLTRCVGYVRSYYVDPQRIEPREMLVGALEAVQQRLAPMLVEIQRDADERATSVRVDVYGESQTFSLEKVDDLYKMNWKLLDVFEFVERRLPEKDRVPDIEYAAVNGMLETLDPHSVMLAPDLYREMKLGTAGEFGGLGIVISVRDGQLTIVSVIDDTPAYRARLQSGDRIVQINEESTVSMPLNDAVNRLRGKAGTKVTVWIARDGWAEPKSYAIERAKITLRSAEGHALGSGVGYIRIKHFQQNTYDDLMKELQALRTSGHARGLVLDLRDNPGGLLEQAIAVSDAFLDEGTIVTTVGAASKLREEKKATHAGTLDEIPIVVLVNHGSASASEIVAGALKNNDRALVLGDRTFGKGSVQVLYDIDDAALKLTIAQYLTPGDRSIQSVGIVPDVLALPMVVADEHVDLFATDRDARGERDLPKHLEHDGAFSGDGPELVLKYLEEKETDEPRREGFQPDKVIRVAEALLTRVTSPSRAEMFAVARDLFDTLSRAEDELLRKALGDIGVDWRRAPRRLAPEAPTLTVTARTEPPDGRINAGETLKVVLSVRNDGTRPLHRVHGITRSENGRFDNLELVLGRIRPGETRTWELPVELSKAALSRRDDILLDLFSDGERLPGEASVPVTVEGLQRPNYAFSLQVRDDESGNGDGIAQRGERFSLRIRVRNTGPGAALKGVASVKNNNGETVYIHSGRERFEDLRPNAERVMAFDVEVRPSFEEPAAELELTLLDTKLRTQTKHVIHLPVGPPSTGGVEKADGFVRVPGTSVPLHAAASAEAGLIGTLSQGDVLKFDAKAGGFLRVPLPDGELGWVAEGEVERLDTAGQVRTHFLSKTRPLTPRIDVVGLPPALSVDGSGAPISVDVAFPAGEPGARRIAYVYVNQRKVVFEERESEAGDAMVVPIRSDIPLEPGSNRITVFARVGDGPAARRTFVVRRAGKSPDAITDVR